MCMIDDADEKYRIYSESFHVARKEHTCAECGRTIAKGEQYKRVGALGARWVIWRTCSHCRIGQDWLQKECGGFFHAMVEEDLCEHVADMMYTAPLSLAKLIVGIRRKWKPFFRDGLMKQPVMPPVH